MRKGEKLSEEQKQKMAEGLRRKKHAKTSAEDRMAERVAGMVLQALQGKIGAARDQTPDIESFMDSPDVVEMREPAPDYERPAASMRSMPKPVPVESFDEPVAINQQVERAVALMESINPSIYDRTSASALLSAVRKLADRIGGYLQQSAPGPTDLRCRICGVPVNPERPAAIRVVKNSQTGLEENVFFHSSSCVLMWDSGRRTLPQVANGGKGPMVTLD